MELDCETVFFHATGQVRCMALGARCREAIDSQVVVGGLSKKHSANCVGIKIDAVVHDLLLFEILPSIVAWGMVCPALDSGCVAEKTLSYIYQFVYLFT